MRRKATSKEVILMSILDCKMAVKISLNKTSRKRLRMIIRKLEDKIHLNSKDKQIIEKIKQEKFEFLEE